MRAYQQLCFSKAKSELPELPLNHMKIVDSIRKGDKERAVATLRRDICTFFSPEDIMEGSQNNG